MRKVLLIFLLLFAVNSYSQCDSSEYKALEREYEEAKKDCWMGFTIGIFSNMIGTVSLVEDTDLRNPDVAWPFFIFNGFGVTFEILAVARLRKKKKELDNYYGKTQ